MTRTKTTLNAIKAIPREKLPGKLSKTVLGIGIAALSAIATTKWGAPWYVGWGGGILGGVTIWGELVTTPVKLLGAVVVDLWKQVKG